MIVGEDFVFQTSLIHRGIQYFVANGLKGDVPVDENGYLVMVNERGDRVAFRVPGGEWEIDSKTLTGYNRNIPNYVNAISVPISSLENK
ncbi:hypothetical protein AAHW68_07235 [Klebsiella pneumoniae]|uniref:hypothetical protein n=1 Tax=Klebsiella TaxID=570 RepID=UPI002052B369|nr:MULTISPECIES: hypothetical protein [Klebsiella]DAZ20602.1 MAG TPA: Glycogen debranching enzyme [Caudoviricetes sp.]HAV7868263.1 hypothetical protein [Escherichia coli]MDP0983273.1 hypothetical protein [Klebsiella variicola]MDP1158970.1 hypothetical protein [Klebsiella variicola]MDP1362635.1 hypothetical protein [Klebsiella variicola]